VQKIRTRTRRPPADNASGGEPIEILLVEDTGYDARRTMNALKTGKVRNRVSWVEDGVEAMEHLRRQGAHAEAPRPDLILLDWYMPRMHGEEVLEQIKKDPDLKRIPVVIMTSSDQEADVLKAYTLHANCYVTKPVNVDQFIDKVRSIETFWLSIVRAQERLKPGEGFLRAGFEVRGMQAVEQEKIADKAVSGNLLQECAAGVAFLAKQLQQLGQCRPVEVQDGLDESAGTGALAGLELLDLVHQLAQSLEQARFIHLAALPRAAGLRTQARGELAVPGRCRGTCARRTASTGRNCGPSAGCRCP
jgi:two-component system, chemotaxis family, response regulator Rcp1